MKILRSSIIYVFLGFLPMGINFLLSPLYSHILSPEQNAILGQAAIFQSLLMVFLSLSIDSAFSRFYFDYCNDDKKLKEYMSSIVIFIILISIVVFLCFALFGNEIFYAAQKNNRFTYSEYGIWVFATTFSTVIQSFFLAYYRNRENVNGFAKISLSFFFLSLAGTLAGLLIFKAEAYGAIVGRSVTFLFLAFILLFLFFKKVGFFLKPAYLKESLRYSIPIVPYVLLMSLYGNIDRLMVERYFTLTDLGIYNFAFLMSGAVAVFITAGQNVVTPIIYKLWSEKIPDNNQLARVFKWYHFTCTAALCFGLALAVIFTELFIAKDYQSILNYIGPLFLAYIFRLYYIMYLDSLFFHKRTKWIFLITLVSFLTGLASNIILIPYLGILGVSISVMIINIVQAAGAYLQLYLCRLNDDYYKMSINHFYTIILIVAYFTSLAILTYSGADISKANYFPMVITVIFFTFYLYNNWRWISKYVQRIINGKL